ncbi:MAG: hypothetical protein ACOC7W_05905 [Desulfosalsimonas sp.]
MKGKVLFSAAALFLVLAFFLSSGCAGTRVVVDHDPGRTDRNERRYEKHGSRGGPPPWAPAHGLRAKKYRYYPSAQVYYDTNRDIYFYYRDGNWRISASLPGRIRMKIDEHVTLEMNTDRPYEYHSDVVRHYPPGQDRKKKWGESRKRARDDW